MGDTLTSSYWDGSAWVTAATTPVGFDTTQVGLYALAAQDGTVLDAAFDSFTIEHAPGADVSPDGPFVLQAEKEKLEAQKTLETELAYAMTEWEEAQTALEEAQA